jgi:LCP family protein required for cell wall assembly
MKNDKRRYKGKRVAQRSELRKSPRKPKPKAAGPKKPRPTRLFNLTDKQRRLFGSSALGLGVAGLAVFFTVISRGVKGFLHFFSELAEPSFYGLIGLALFAVSALLISFGGFLLISRKLKKTSLIYLISSSSLTVLAVTALIIARILIGLPESGPIVLGSGGDDRDADGVPITAEPRDGGVFTFLLAGIHDGMTDTLMVATLDIGAETCHVLSVPRDTAIADTSRSVPKINGAHSRGGMAQLKKEVASVIGFEPQFSAVIDYNAIGELVDAVDGVEFDVPMRMYLAPFPAEGERGINLRAGPQKLNGSQAMQLLRWRTYGSGTLKGYFERHGFSQDGYINDDFGRIKIQQMFLAAAAKKAFSNWAKIPEYIDIAKDNVKSDDIDWGEMLGFAEAVNKIGIENIIFHTLPSRPVENPTGEGFGSRIGSYVAVNSAETLELVNETINPFSFPVTENMVKHLKLTGRVIERPVESNDEIIGGNSAEDERTGGITDERIDEERPVGGGFGDDGAEGAG